MLEKRSLFVGIVLVLPQWFCEIFVPKMESVRPEHRLYLLPFCTQKIKVVCPACEGCHEARRPARPLRFPSSPSSTSTGNFLSDEAGAAAPLLSCTRFTLGCTLRRPSWCGWTGAEGSWHPWSWNLVFRCGVSRSSSRLLPCFDACVMERRKQAARHRLSSLSTEDQRPRGTNSLSSFPACLCFLSLL